MMGVSLEMAYIAQNPAAFLNYGNVGLLIARLQGKAVRVARSLSPGQSTDVNTIIGDKMIGVLGPNNMGPDGWPIQDTNHEVVLRTSSQCLPMIRYDTALVNTGGWQPFNRGQQSEGIQCINYLKTKLDAIVDRLCSIVENLRRSLPSRHC